MAITLSKWKDVIKSPTVRNVTDAVIDRKIVDALEKVSQALRTLAWKKSVEQSINPIQLQILSFLFTHKDDRAKVSLLAREFNISKASISDTIKLLETKGLIEKIYDESLSKQFVIQLTQEGSIKAAEVSLFDEVLLSGVGKIVPLDKEKLYFLLSEIILGLHEQEVITHQRMCKSCKHYRGEGEKHYCSLLQQYMGIPQLRIDCDEFEKK